jgi:hypothetical protein
MREESDPLMDVFPHTGAESVQEFRVARISVTAYAR